MTHYLAYTIDCSNKDVNVIVAWLNYLGFEMILEEPGHVVAYLAPGASPIETKELSSTLGIDEEEIRIDRVENKNWNEEWENNFEPVLVEGQCYIRALFHEPQDQYPFQMIIRPRMAFGTGHHETSYMMIQQMLTLDVKGDEVFDFGCGTGILSVFAKMKGASKIMAIDIEEESCANTLDHFRINNLNTDSLQVECGNIEVVPESYYFDLILANINRHVLLESPKELFLLLKPEGKLLISGILKSDKELVLKTYTKNGFRLISVLERGEWLCIYFKKID